MYGGGERKYNFKMYLNEINKNENYKHKLCKGLKM